ncbi:MAG: cupin domain-containing protein [Hyphomicrobium sp.]|jgi:quercetin dioxygenase-like cupin family protein|uniref:cupin domain-containing protein n=1 Tax=Hyphomicrobium sp. TaxID=82 RepID=UPI0025BC368F|nr:cupin domain-containing protein [Hyphomicrobium sp.]MBX9861370.1 cupin domain-containing protein [Hyphomicrobium sp.]
MKRMLSGAVAGLILAIVSTHALAQGDQIDRLTISKMENFELSGIAWKHEALLPGAAESALIAGDPSKPGVFMAYLKFPANYEIPAHTHPFAEVVTVLKGTVWNGMGDKLDRQKGDKLGAGSSFTLPAGHAHYLWNEEETIVLLTATGPWNITYINPADDPRK